MGSLDGCTFVVLEANLRLREASVLQPALFLDNEENGMRIWLQSFVPQPWFKTTCRTARLALTDAVHHFFDNAQLGMVHGEFGPW